MRHLQQNGGCTLDIYVIFLFYFILNYGGDDKHIKSVGLSLGEMCLKCFMSSCFTVNKQLIHGSSCLTDKLLILMRLMVRR